MTEAFSYKIIKEEYGVNVLELVRKYERISKTKGRYQSHLRFYLQCKHEELTPKGIKMNKAHFKRRWRQIPPIANV